jgi:hypothetical protein
MPVGISFYFSPNESKYLTALINWQFVLIPKFEFIADSLDAC